MSIDIMLCIQVKPGELNNDAIPKTKNRARATWSLVCKKIKSFIDLKNSSKSIRVHRDIYARNV
jgi:hypothetical protein